MTARDGLVERSCLLDDLRRGVACPVARPPLPAERPVVTARPVERERRGRLL